MLEPTWNVCFLCFLQPNPNSGGISMKKKKRNHIPSLDGLRVLPSLTFLQDCWIINLYLPCVRWNLPFLGMTGCQEGHATGSWIQGCFFTTVLSGSFMLQLKIDERAAAKMVYSDLAQTQNELNVGAFDRLPHKVVPAIWATYVTDVCLCAGDIKDEAETWLTAESCSRPCALRRLTHVQPVSGWHHRG